MSFLTVAASFFIIALAARQIGQWFFQARLPFITGYLFAGIIVGPFVLDIIHQGVAEDLRFVDEFSLAIIAFAAGAELHLRELRSQFRSITWHTSGQFVTIYILGTVVTFLLAGTIPFARNMDTAGRLAISLLVAIILTSRSPASIVAVVSELRARGPFTKTALGVTMLMDIVVIVAFAVSASLASVLLTGIGFSLKFVLLLGLDLSAAVLTGWLVYRALIVILASKLEESLKIALVLLVGFAVFEASAWINHWSHQHLSFDIFIEPLLATMIGSFLLTNRSIHRIEFMQILETIAPVVYVAFFTLTGASMRIDALGNLWIIALVLFAVRILAIFVGSGIGATIAGDQGAIRRWLWLSFISHAGVALGLAREVADEFPEFGEEFATLIVAVIILNQIVGPIALKYAIRRSGESRLPEEAAPDEIRDVVIFGLEQQSLSLARQLSANGWHVTVADSQSTAEFSPKNDRFPIRLFDPLDENALRQLLSPATDAIVAMTRDDALNHMICEFAYENCGIPRLVVRQHDNTWRHRFNELGAMIVNPTDALINLMDNLVRAPASAAMFLHRDPTHEIAQITLTDPDFNNMPLRNLLLPGEVLILGITRDNETITPHGYTKLRTGDEITLVGPSEELREVTRKLGY